MASWSNWLGRAPLKRAIRVQSPMMPRFFMRLYSTVVVRLTCNQKVSSSILDGGSAVMSEWLRSLT